MQTSIDLAFADGTYTFKLGLKQIAEVERACDSGIGAIVARLLKGRYLLDGETVGAAAEAAFKAKDVTEIVRQGLVGGGAGMVDGQEAKVGSLRANELIATYVDGQALRDNWTVAASIALALMEGYTPPRKPEPAGEQTQDSGSTSEQPTPRARSSGSRRKKSTG